VLPRLRHYCEPSTSGTTTSSIDTSSVATIDTSYDTTNGSGSGSAAGVAGLLLTVIAVVFYMRKGKKVIKPSAGV
jgi:hypothetical protein